MQNRLRPKVNKPLYAGNFSTTTLSFRAFPSRKNGHLRSRPARFNHTVCYCRLARQCVPAPCTIEVGSCLSGLERAPSDKPSGGTRERFTVFDIVFINEIVFRNDYYHEKHEHARKEKREVGPNIIRGDPALRKPY